MKYSSKFSFTADIKIKDIVTGRQNLSIANIKNLKSLVDIKVSSEKLVPIAFDMGLANVFNRNGDGVDSEGAGKILSSLQDQPLNIEHQRYDIVGHIISAGMYSKPDHNKLDAPVNEPFYISAGAVLYKIINSHLVDFVKWENDEGSFRLGASWEVGFDDYHIARGSNLLSKCTIHSSDEEVEKYSAFLLCNGGTGYDNEGVPVFRLLKGDISSHGVALTLTPAADVKGVYVLEKEDSEEDGEEESESSTQGKNKKDENNISLSTKKNVVDGRDNMNLEQIKAEFDSKLKALKDESKELLVSTASSAAFTLIDTALKEANEKYVKEKEALANLQKETEQQNKELQDKVEKTSAKLADIEKQLSEANEKAIAADKEKAKNARLAAIDSFMADVDSKYSFTKEQRDIVLAKVSSSQVQDAKVAEDLKKEYSVLFASLAKSATPTTTPEDEISKASVQGAVVSNSKGASDDLISKLKNFKVEVEIK